MIVAVCPVAFFTPEHIDMTRGFLRALEPEVDRIGVWFNGGTLGPEGLEMLTKAPVELHMAETWGFYRMWNDGARWARELEADAMLVLNNDIEWPEGALRVLAESLTNASPDVAAASPDPASDFHPGELIEIEAFPAYRGLMGWCFAIRPSMWQSIDERYHVWWGDDELARLLTAAGWRCVRAKGVPVQHPVNETTMRHREGLWEMRAADEALYNSKWS